MQLEKIKRIPINDVAQRLGVLVNGNTKLNCWNSSAHNNGDANPSMSIDIKTNRCKCFACGVGGTTVDMVMGYRDIDFNKAVNELAEMIGGNPKTTKAKNNNNKSYTLEQTKANLERNGKKIKCCYVYDAGKQRYIKIMYADKKCVKKGYFYTEIAFNQWVSGRECEAVLYNQKELTKRPDDIICIPEGESDTETLKELGFLALTSGGTDSLTVKIAAPLRGRYIVIFADNDEAGYKDATKRGQILLLIAKSVRQVDIPKKWQELFNETMPNKADVTDLVNKYKTKHGDDGLRNVIDEMIKDAKDVKEIVTEVTEVTVDPKEKKDIDKEIFPDTPFPYEVLSSGIRDLVFDLGEALHITPDLLACNVLPIVGSAVGNILKVSPKHGWKESSFIWFMTVAPTGAGKTHVINTLLEPLEKLQSDAFLKYEEEMRIYDQILRQARKDPNIDIPEKPKLKQYKISDFTMETLVDVFYADPRGILLYRDELAALFYGANQYKGGKGNDEQQLLELYNGNALKTDRKKATIYAKQSGASIIGGIQPSVLKQVFKDDSFDNGLPPRFLMLHVETTKRKFSRKPVNKEFLDYWDNFINWCYKLKTANGEPKVLPLNKDALDVFEAFFNEFEEIYPFVSPRIKVFLPKLKTYCLRLTGVLHTIHAYPSIDDFETDITAKTITDAVKLTKYFAGQIVKCMKIYGEQEEQLNEYQKRLIDVLRKLQPEINSGKLLLSKIRSKFNKGLPEYIHHSPEKIRSILTNDFRLETHKSTNNLSCLIWEQEKIEKLFSMTTVTSVTTVIQKSENSGSMVTEVAEVTVDSSEKELVSNFTEFEV